MSSSHLKNEQKRQLKSRRNKLAAERTALNREVEDIQRRLKDNKEKLASLDKQLKKLEEDGDLYLSDHALLRYLERVEGIDLEAMRSAILNEKLIQMHETLGSGKFPIPGIPGAKVVIRGSAIVSIITSE